MRTVGVLSTVRSYGAGLYASKIEDLLRAEYGFTVFSFDIGGIFAPFFGPSVKSIERINNRIIQLLAHFGWIKRDHLMFGIFGISLQLPKWFFSTEIKQCDTLFLIYVSPSLRVSFFDQDTFKDKHLILIPVDEGFFTGGCHYSFECDGFRYGCESCPAVSKLFQGTVASQFKDFRRMSVRANISILFPTPDFREKWQDFLHSDSNSARQHVFTLFPKSLSDLPLSKVVAEENLPVGDGVVIFLIRSSKEARKGCALFVEVCHQLRHMIDDFSAKVIIRTVGDDYLRINLDGICSVEDHGLVTESYLTGLYKSADVFVSPSIQDSGPMMVLEALAEGCQVICSDVGYGSMLCGGVGIEIVDRGDVVALREAVRGFITQREKIKKVEQRNRIKQYSASLRKENIEKLRILFS